MLATSRRNTASRLFHLVLPTKGFVLANSTVCLANSTVLFSQLYGLFSQLYGLFSQLIGCYFKQNMTGWWFQIFFIFTPTWGNDPI